MDQVGTERVDDALASAEVSIRLEESPPTPGNSLVAVSLAFRSEIEVCDAGALKRLLRILACSGNPECYVRAATHGCLELVEP